MDDISKNNVFRKINIKNVEKFHYLALNIVVWQNKTT